MEYSFIIRRARAEDAGDIKSVLLDSFRKYMKEAKLSGTIDALEETVEDISRDIETKDVFIALVNGVPVGTIRVELQPDGTAYITRFGVLPDYHHLGIGKALMNFVDKLLLSKGAVRARLYTASNHSELVRFYYDRGFYVESVSYERGYPRACMVKEYVSEKS